LAVVVFGSINMDLVVRAPRLPRAGETLIGHTFFTAPGGKGANQAVACSRLGAPTRMIGRVGDDVFGTVLRDGLSTYGVDVSGVAVQAGQPSGVALIAVNDAAENQIIVVPGANGTLGSADLAHLESALAGARVLLLQLEVPLESVVAAARLAHQSGVTVILDPAPARLLPAELYVMIDILTPNETEAASLVEFSLSDEDAVTRAAKILIKRGARSVIVKLGCKGAYWTDGSTGKFFTAFEVEAVDTVAAGDAFNGGLAVALSEGRARDEAIRWGMAAGALAVTKVGAQPSMPDRAAVTQMLA
jgi:ribokinase